jgi:hypothetical protein
MKATKANYKQIGETNSRTISHCARCNRTIEVGQGYYVGQKTVSDKEKTWRVNGSSFIHKECMADLHKIGYHSTARDAGAVYGSKHCKCYGEKEYGLELEFVGTNTRIADEYLTSRGWTAKRDGSVRIEFTHERQTSFSHYTQILKGLERLGTPTESTHFTISCNCVDYIRHYRKSIVNYLQDTMDAHDVSIKNTFGRDYHSQWAKRYTDASGQDTNRYYWINLTHANCVEFRINKFDGTNAKRIIETMKFERAFILACEKGAQIGGRDGVRYIQKWINKNA